MAKINYHHVNCACNVVTALNGLSNLWDRWGYKITGQVQKIKAKREQKKQEARVERIFEQANVCKN